MTEERTFTDSVPGGGTVELGVTAEATNLEIEDTVLSISRFQADAVHAKLAEQTARWRERLYEMREELGGDPAPEPHASALPPCPMPGRMRAWETADAVWLQWVAPGRELNLDQAEAVRVPVSATDSDEDLVKAANRWLTGYGCPPAGTVAWMLPQLRRHRDRLAEERRGGLALRVLVIYVADVEASAAWYRSALGVRWTRERHGDGPPHMSAEIGGVLLELYPAGERAVSRVRIQLEVADAFGDADRAPDAFPRQMEDLDGNTVVVTLR
ncbi:VOC family protein [Tsukamurella pseudospumae]|uniref:Glyoxalase/fosfomycin resistance/dioxygenase domain-containing protein n=1 Tax=Tsukamurella pseudospumae TaxID=239498 RepID=A0A138AE54_9ACTN|nr:VOC family protein [Tsukamurella pseudospumae]KXP08732.1 hypothetical protein AXK60_08640 [Tsukamurella pseudospumae]